MRFKLLMFALAWVMTVALIVNHPIETFQRATAALTCYWSDPGPPLSVPMPPDPQSAAVKGGVPSVALDYTPAAQRETQLPSYLKSVTTRPLRDLEMVPSAAPTTAPSAAMPTILPLGSLPADAPTLQSPFEEPSIPPTPVPTLGVLAVAPEVTVTPRPLLLDPPASAAAAWPTLVTAAPFAGAA